MNELNDQELEQVAGGIAVSTSTGLGGASALFGGATSNSQSQTTANPFSTSGYAANQSNAHGLAPVAVSGATSSSGASLF
jgi:bacteriocin-like protein